MVQGMCQMKKLIFFMILVVSFALCNTVSACDDESEVSIFSCDAVNGHKFIEICASLPVGGENGYIVYRFGSMDPKTGKRTIELEYPNEKSGSFKRFFGATYTYKGVYTQSIRFVSGGHSYTVFTRSGKRDNSAGVEVRNLRTGKITTVSCCDMPRFYISELQGVLPCDPETPIGQACIH